jgi:hypothetical protein
VHICDFLLNLIRCVRLSCCLWRCCSWNRCCNIMCCAVDGGCIIGHLMVLLLMLLLLAVAVVMVLAAAAGCSLWSGAGRRRRAGTAAGLSRPASTASSGSLLRVSGPRFRPFWFLIPTSHGRMFEGDAPPCHTIAIQLPISLLEADCVPHTLCFLQRLGFML